MKILILSFLVLISSSSFSFEQGEIIKASDINQIQNNITNIQSFLKNKTLSQEYVLYSGNKYLDGSSSYTLWSSSKHKQWDRMALHVSYDNGSNPQVFEIVLGSSYSYNSNSESQTTLLTTYSGTYRRVLIDTTGIDVYNGAGGGWHLNKVIGIIDEVHP